MVVAGLRSGRNKSPFRAKATSERSTAELIGHFANMECHSQEDSAHFATPIPDSQNRD